MDKKEVTPFPGVYHELLCTSEGEKIRDLEHCVGESWRPYCKKTVLSRAHEPHL
jgi:hypothetical protein